MANKKQISAVLSNPQEKKNVVRYDATDDDAVLANAYPTKAGLKEIGNPKKIKVTIEAA